MALGCNQLLGIDERPARGDGGALPGNDGGFGDGGGASAGGSAYAAAVLADNPLVYLRFGEPAGTIAVKDEMNRFTGTFPIDGVTLGAAGALAHDNDTAAHFTGARGIAMSAGADFSPTAAMTVEAWIRAGAVDQYAYVVSHETFTAQRAGWSLLAGTDGLLFERWAAGHNTGSVGGPVLTGGQWHHVVATYAGPPDGAEHLWLDGVLLSPPGASTSQIPAIPEGWTIGAQNCDCSGNRFRGELDELAIYPTALSEARILAHLAAAK